jgi:hypothetical protein
MIRFAGRRIALAGVALTLVCAGGAWALVQQLPPGVQVNSDAANGILPAQDVGGETPNADVVGGALTAGKVAVPWAIFRQETSATTADQIFVRSFASGAWKTQGSGTVGGSGVSPTFMAPASLNFDPTQDGEAPSIDFAGAGRTVPWATWYEQTTALSNQDQIFASRFDNSGDANNGKWIFAGQQRGPGAIKPPSLNIHTDEKAINPSVAGGSTGAGNPGPWITWQEQGLLGQQIFVVKPVGPGQTNCTGVTPAANDPSAAPEGGFCWQQVGVERSNNDPSLNVDQGRDGVEPDIAFTGSNDTVPWVVWYEQSPGARPATNELVFAAKAVAGDTGVTGTVDGGFHWQVVGDGTTGLTEQLDNTAMTGGPCGATQATEDACSLNKDALTGDAEDPRVAAGTMTPGGVTVPWVVWDEQVGGSGPHQIFAARLVGGDHFELANNGAPLSVPSNDSTRPDITFSGNTPYVSWRENEGGGNDKGFLGHFVPTAGVPTFVLDESNVSLTSDAQADVRLPISSSCTANPFNADGGHCQGGAVGTPFFLATSGTTPRELLADAYQPGTPTTGTPSAVTSASATVSGSVDQAGGPVSVSFNFGTTTAYAQTTTPQPLGPAGSISPSTTPFTASLTGLPASTTIHYQAVVTTDFGTFKGGDQTLTTSAAPTPPDKTPPTVSAKIVKSTIKKLLSSGKLKVKVTISEAGKVKLKASTKIKKRHHKTKKVGLGSKTVAFSAAGTKTVSITVPSSAAGKLRHLRHSAKIKVAFSGTDTAGNTSATKTTSATFPRK